MKHLHHKIVNSTLTLVLIGGIAANFGLAIYQTHVSWKTTVSYGFEEPKKTEQVAERGPMINESDIIPTVDLAKALPIGAIPHHGFYVERSAPARGTHQ